MVTKRRKSDADDQSGIVEAVETLSSIADMDLESELAVSHKHDLMVGDHPFSFRTVHWLQESDADETLLVIKDTFRTVLNYLRKFYRKEQSNVLKGQSIEGIKTIMVLVGEAAKKLDRYLKASEEKEHSVLELKEYKQLQNFYLKKIAPYPDHTRSLTHLFPVAKELPALDASKARLIKRKLDPKQIRFAYIDLESVKKD